MTWYCLCPLPAVVVVGRFELGNCDKIAGCLVVQCEGTNNLESSYLRLMSSSGGSPCRVDLTTLYSVQVRPFHLFGRDIRCNPPTIHSNCCSLCSLFPKHHHSTRPPRHSYRYSQHDVVQVSTSCLLRSCLPRPDTHGILSTTILAFFPPLFSLSSHIPTTRYHNISFFGLATTHIHSINSLPILLQLLVLATMALSKLIRIPVTRHAAATANGTKALVGLMHKYDMTPTMESRYERDHNRTLVIRRDDNTVEPVYVAPLM